MKQELSSCWDGRAFEHNTHGLKCGELLCPFPWRWELGPRLTQCRLGRGLPPYQVASWSIQLFNHNRHGPKIWGGCTPFGELGPCLTQCGFPFQVASWSMQPFGHNTHGPPISSHVYCEQTAGWIKMPLGTEVGLGPGDIVLDGDPAPPQWKGQSSPPLFGPLVWACVPWVARLSNCWALVHVPDRPLEVDCYKR